MPEFGFTIYDNLDGRFDVPFMAPVQLPDDATRLFEFDGKLWLQTGSGSGPALVRGTYAEGREEHVIYLCTSYLARVVPFKEYDQRPPAAKLSRYCPHQLTRGNLFGLDQRHYVVAGEKAIVVQPVTYRGGNAYSHPKTLDWLFGIAPEHDTWCPRCLESWRGDKAPASCWAGEYQLVYNDPVPNDDPPHFTVYRKSDGTWRKPMYDTSGLTIEGQTVPLQLSLI
jgi:hypothetical protein